MAGARGCERRPQRRCKPLGAASSRVHWAAGGTTHRCLAAGCASEQGAASAASAAQKEAALPGGGMSAPPVRAPQRGQAHRQTGPRRLHEWQLRGARHSSASVFQRRVVAAARCTTRLRVGRRRRERRERRPAQSVRSGLGSLQGSCELERVRKAHARAAGQPLSREASSLPFSPPLQRRCGSRPVVVSVARALQRPAVRAAASARRQPRCARRAAQTLLQSARSGAPGRPPGAARRQTHVADACSRRGCSACSVGVARAAARGRANRIIRRLAGVSCCSSPRFRLGFRRSVRATRSGSLTGRERRPFAVAPAPWRVANLRPKP